MLMNAPSEERPADPKGVLLLRRLETFQGFEDVFRTDVPNALSSEWEVFFEVCFVELDRERPEARSAIREVVFFGVLKRGVLRDDCAESFFGQDFPRCISCLCE